MEDAVWYALIEGGEYGPMSRAQLLACLREGTLAGSDLVWRPGFEGWLPLQELKEFWRPPAQAQAYELVPKPAISRHSVAPPPLPKVNLDVTAPPPLPDIGGRTKHRISGVLWYLVQGLIVFAVVASNIHWQWTPNHYLASIIGFCIALCVTGGFNELRTWQADRAARKKVH